MPRSPVLVAPAAFARGVRHDGPLPDEERRDPDRCVRGVEVHTGDLVWGLGYWDRVQWPADPDAPELRVLMTVEMQSIERQLIRAGVLTPEDRVEKQLACTVRSIAWWRRQQKEDNEEAAGRKAQPPEVERQGEVLLHPDAATKGCRPRNPLLAAIMGESGCSRWIAYRRIQAAGRG